MQILVRLLRIFPFQERSCYSNSRNDKIKKSKWERQETGSINKDPSHIKNDHYRFQTNSKETLGAFWLLNQIRKKINNNQSG